MQQYLIRYENNAVTQIIAFTGKCYIAGSFMVETLENAKVALTALNVDCTKIDEKINSLKQ